MRAADRKRRYEAVKGDCLCFCVKGKKEIDDLKSTSAEQDRGRNRAEVSFWRYSIQWSCWKSLNRSFEKEKKKKNIVDFSDVMHYASNLDDPVAAEEYREKFVHIHG